MKRLWIYASLLALVSLLCGIGSLGAAEPTAVPQVEPPGSGLAVSFYEGEPATVEEELQIWLITQAIQHPWLGGLLLVMAAARLGLKPLMAAAHRYVESTAAPEDDAALARLEASAAFRWLAFAVDVLGSIKLGTVLLLISRFRGRGTAEGGRALAIAGLAVLFFLGGPGCAGMGEGSLALKSEKSIASSYTAVDEFLRWEEVNRSQVSERVTEIADTLRAKFPPAHEAALNSLAAYKRSRSATDYDQLRGALETLSTMTQEAQQARAQIAAP